MSLFVRTILKYYTCTCSLGNWSRVPNLPNLAKFTKFTRFRVTYHWPLHRLAECAIRYRPSVRHTVDQLMVPVECTYK